MVDSAGRVVSLVARVLEAVFFFGAGLVLVVIVLTFVDIVRAIAVPDSPSKSEIDAMNRAA
ncbi:MAG: hypothetical protein JWO13_996 [Acidobacteriales bacterium]|nr:hypothetical protein [Terriglobales bacterium]